MKLNLFTILCLFVFLISYGQVSAQRKKAPRPQTKKAVEVIATRETVDAKSNFTGEFEGNVYKNKFFGLKLIIPENWIVSKPEVNTAIKEIGSEMVKGKNSRYEKALDQANQRLTVLYSASREVIGVENNAVVVFSAERDPPLATIRNGSDYLKLVLHTYKNVQLPPGFKVIETIKSEKLGGETLYYLDIEAPGARQRLYATHRKGHSLFFTLTYIIDKDLEVIKQAISDSDFAWKE